MTQEELIIKHLQQENQRLKERINMTININRKNKELHNKIDKAIEILKLCNSKCAKETIEVLKKED